MRRAALLSAVLLAVPTVASARDFAGMRADAVDAPATFLGVDVGAEQTFDTDAARRHAFLGDVLSVLEKSDSPIAKNTLDAIESGLVRLNTLDRLTIEDCGQLLRENPRLWEGIASPEDCGKRVPHEVLARVSGYQNANRIYVNPFRAPAEMATTVVHEVNHVANASQDHYANAQEIAREEFRAFWVAQQFEDHGRPAGGAWLGWLKHYVVDEYALEGVRAEDLPDRPEGNLDNRVHAGVVSMR